ncbi:MAG: DUF4968 domain-containing protein, partial [bacterium]|nr:DUF4968 domain-containing protein [bacterium]
LSTGTVEVAVYAPDVVRVRYHWDSPLWSKEEEALAKKIEQWPPVACTVTNTGTTLELRTAELLVQLVLTPVFQANFKTPDGRVLNADYHTEYDVAYDPLLDPHYDETSVHNGDLPDGFALKSVRVMPADEAYFGLGDCAGPLNRRGRSLQCWNADFYDWGEYQNPKYLSLPFFYGVRPPANAQPAMTYGLFFNNENRAVFKFWSGLGDTYSFEAGGGQLDYFFFGGGSNHQMRAVLDRYTEVTGRPCMLPKWFFGFQQSRWSYWNQSWIEWLAAEFRAQRIPCDAIHMDIDYMRQSDTYYQQLWFNAGRFPNPYNMITNCLARGVRIVPIIEPYLNTSDPLYPAADAQHHFVKNNDQSTFVNYSFFGPVSWLDFSSSNCVNWWKDNLVDFLQQYPFEAVWNDLSEPADAMTTPRDALYWCDGRYPLTSDRRRWHMANKNTIALRETSCTDGARRAVRPAQRPAILARAGWPGIQRTAANWSGDNHASWDHCRHNIRCGLSVMISGQANYGHDIGGFVGGNNAELYTRWLAWGILNPLCRVHSNGNGAQDPSINEREPWRFGSPYTEWNRHFIETRYQLMPMLYSLAYQSIRTGEGMNTPVVY